MPFFDNPAFGDVRTGIKDGKIWFVGEDIAKALGHVDPGKAVRTHRKRADVLLSPTNGGVQSVKIINRPDLYRLITHSKLPAAEKFGVENMEFV